MSCRSLFSQLFAYNFRWAQLLHIYNFSGTNSAKIWNYYSVSIDHLDNKTLKSLKNEAIILKRKKNVLQRIFIKFLTVLYVQCTNFYLQFFYRLLMLMFPFNIHHFSISAMLKHRQNEKNYPIWKMHFDKFYSLTENTNTLHRLFIHSHGITRILFFFIEIDFFRVWCSFISVLFLSSI